MPQPSRPPLKLYLCGSIAVVQDARTAFESALPGRQGRRALAYLALRRRTGVSRDELADAIWSGEEPAALDSALNALVSKVRTWIGATRGGPLRLSASTGAYRLELPPGAWIDLERANDYVDRADTLQRSGDLDGAYGWASAAWSTTHQPFLPAENGPWIESVRSRLENLHLAALEIFGRYHVKHRKTAQAVDSFEQILAVNPLRESAYRGLMTAHRDAGNHAEAAAAFERCRATLERELEVAPSAETRALYAAAP